MTHLRFAKTVTQLGACTCDQSVSHVVGDTVILCHQQDPGLFDVKAGVNGPLVSYWRSNISEHAHMLFLQVAVLPVDEHVFLTNML